MMKDISENDENAHPDTLLLMRKTKEARFQHRLHVVMAVIGGCSSREIANIFDDSQRAVQMWVRAYRIDGIRGLEEAERKGRSARLSPEDIDELMHVTALPSETCRCQRKMWNGKMLSEYIFERYGITLGLRQCERYLRKFKDARERVKV